MAILVKPVVTTHVVWCPPNAVWYKINTDGASRGNPGVAAMGGMIRESRVGMLACF